ncbi:hypothetical protein OAO87_00460 [bacterium]|nr:hypothetical protein [bacterium]
MPGGFVPPHLRNSSASNALFDMQALHRAVDGLGVQERAHLAQWAQRVQTANTRHQQPQRNVELPTENISLISHTHGRARRVERNIQRKELQAAIKYGRKERANPGRDGSPRWSTRTTV